MKSLFSLFASLVIFPAFVFAARPLSVGDAGTVEKGSVEVEIGTEYAKASVNETNLSLAVTAGLLDSLDVAAEVPFVFVDAKDASDAEGFSDISLSAKFNFLKGDAALPDTALSFTYQTESGNDERGLGAGKPEYALDAIFSKEFKYFSTHVNIGYAFKKDFNDSDNEDAFTYGLAFEYPVTEKLNLVAEVTGDTVLKRKFDDNSCNALVGANYSLNEKITLDFGVGSGISRSDIDLKVTSGITVGF